MSRCDQQGRVAGGLGAIAEWFPIKVCCCSSMLHHGITPSMWHQVMGQNWLWLAHFEKGVPASQLLGSR